MAVTIPAVGGVVLFNQGINGILPGGDQTLPALVLSAGGTGGLIVSLQAFGIQGGGTFSGVPHISTASPTGIRWSWPAASGNSNS
jgi:hypothetical protein